MRRGEVRRETKETRVNLSISLDGDGLSEVHTGVAFLDHMLDLVARHGLFDLKVQAEGDLEVDAHHTVEDVGICLGLAVRQALGSGEGMRRYGWAILPMDETLATVALDLGGRPYLCFSIPGLDGGMGDFPMELLPEFFQAFCNNAGANMHIRVDSGRNRHHVAEAIYKAFSKALDQAVSIDPRVKGIPSTKGRLIET
ncbi:MAG TPA: imidazoleglycerol-phosphate dehydratase HisB [Proteobacteria bacterium]|nr:imidazoleglycerol-phosphate dehydratase [bacterium BMS3Abin14]HDL53335.1 imidazoleglycerol-phosphate dehydratase HisB [Pseudomonadota bacterium]